MESIRAQMRTAGGLRVDATDAQFTETPACAPIDTQDAAKLIREAAAREGLTPDLLRAVIGKESSFRPCAVSAKGAMGLMQLMPGTAQQLGVMDPFDPKQNIDGGSRLLKQLLGRYGDDLTRALGAYNAGPGQVDRYGGLPPFSETVDYVTDILGRLRPKVAPDIQ
jgi:soluble lytic murein transglycosylase-like protein